MTSCFTSQDLNGEVGPGGRHINSHITTTPSGDDRLTEFIITWETPVYVLVKRFKLGNHLQIAKLLATFLLSVELVYAMYGRFTKQKLQAHLDQEPATETPIGPE